jgi:hypothetical protein
LFAQFVNTNKQDTLQRAKDYITEGSFGEARAILKDVKSEEAKELYASIRYKGLKVGEVVYNGYYKSTGQRSISNNGVAFVCLDVVDGTALLISVDMIGLTEQYGAILHEEQYKSQYHLDMKDIVLTTIGDEQGKFFMLSKEQYYLYVQNDLLDDYLKFTQPSSVAKKQKKEVDEDIDYSYEPCIDRWRLNDFSQDPDSWVRSVGTINAEGGAYQKMSNYGMYVGIRLCYYVDITQD